jgi:ATP/maltotriose-dependent transcriptional regulator MalT
VLAGRTAECARLDRLLADVQAGRSAVLVLRGEAGIGKTALLAYAGERTQGCRVLRAVGVESELELPFAALHQLCAPLLGGLERLPAPQRDALGTAFGLSSGPQPDRFLVGLALLGLLSDAAEQQPLVSLIDDAHWFDRSSAQVLAFVARRLQVESVLLLFAERDPGGLDELAGLPELRIEALSEDDARALLASVITGPLDDRVRERIIAETRGNPLALLELPHGLPPGALTSGFGVPGDLPGRIEASFRDRVGRLPADTQRLLLVAAAEPIGDPTLLSRAAAELGIPIEAAAPAEAEELLELGAHVIFRHPLLRSAIYRSASPQERREVHGALAAATDPEVDPDRRAWHRAEAAAAPDEDVAAELERSADRAQARGGLAAAAAFLERAAALTPGSAPRAARALAAAEAKKQAGAADTALALLAIAEAGPLDELQRARAEQVRAQIAFTQSRGSDASRLMLAAARRLEPLDPTLAREAYLDALAAALEAGDRSALLELLAHAVSVAAPAQPPRAADLFLTGWAQLITHGFPAGTDLLKRGLIAFRSEPLSGEGEMRALWYASVIAQSLWDDELWDVLSARYVRLARDTGALTALPVALSLHAEVRLQTGELSTAAALIEERDAITEATGNAPLGDYLLLAAWREQETPARERIEVALREAPGKGDEDAITSAEYASAVLYNGLGQYRAALDAAQRSNDHSWAKGQGRVLSELVEAAARTGEPERAAAALDQLSARTRLGGTDWALGVEARARALLSEGQPAEDLYREAIERLSRTRIQTDRARAHLVYGEWLRRERRRIDAREQLRIAHEMFSEMGAEAFAERAARELRATGEKARKRTDDTRGELTPQETQVAHLAADGYSNPEIGAQLFISPRTVEYHLHKVFTKLAIASRGELQHVLPARNKRVHAVVGRRRGES